MKKKQKKVKPSTISVATHSSGTSTVYIKPQLPKEPLVVWGVAKILSKMNIMASEEEVRVWIKKQPKDQRFWYLPVPVLIERSISKVKKTKNSN